MDIKPSKCDRKSLLGILLIHNSNPSYFHIVPLLLPVVNVPGGLIGPRGIRWEFKRPPYCHITRVIPQRASFIHLLMGVVCRLTLSLTVGRSWMRMKRKATTGRMQRREVRKMVSQTLGWIREFLAVPGISKTRQTPSARIPS